MKNVGSLGLMLGIGILIYEAGFTGRLGSLLGAIIDPAQMQDNTGGTEGTGPGTDRKTNPNAGLPTKGILSPTQIGLYALHAGFAQGNPLVLAIAIALAESGGDTGAQHRDANGTTDYGLWQINSVHAQYKPSDLLAPAGNAAAAYTISGGGTNWNPWTTFKNGAYAQHLGDAQQGAAAAIAIDKGLGAAAGGL
jgi:hypothetical protein